MSVESQVQVEMNPSLAMSSRKNAKEPASLWSEKDWEHNFAILMQKCSVGG
jgi:hypothetical protein